MCHGACGQRSLCGGARVARKSVWICVIYEWRRESPGCELVLCVGRSAPEKVQLDQEMQYASGGGVKNVCQHRKDMGCSEIG